MLVFDSTRLNFYKLSDKYFEEFCAMDMDDEVMEFYTSRPHGTREQAMTSYLRYKDYQEKFPDLGGFMAFNKEDGSFAGLGVLIHLELNSQNTSYEVGYRLPQNAWGKGYATEIAERLLEYGFNQLGFSEIFGTTHPAHLVSQKVLTKIGMKKIGSSMNYGGSTVFKIVKGET